MAKHKLFVDLDVHDIEIKSKDVVFKVYQDGEKFGELRLSRGAVVWRGRSDKMGRKMGWTRFNRLMQEARRAETRPPGTRTITPRSKRS